MTQNNTQTIPPVTFSSPTISTLPSPPFIDIQGVPNFRDLGGYPLKSNPKISSVRRNLIFRCAQPSQITARGMKSLQALRVTTLYDLRSGPELERMKAITPVLDIPGTTRVFVPVFADEDYSPESIAIRFKDYAATDSKAGYVRAYADILANAGPAYTRVFTHIRDRPAEGMVVHCTAGKDRTGVFAALVLRLAGVEDEVIAKEYGLTEQGLGDWRKVIVEKLCKDDLKGDREAAERMVGAREENMLAALLMLDEKYGGADGYLKGMCGFGENDLERIRRNVVVEEPPIM